VNSTVAAAQAGCVDLLTALEVAGTSKLGVTVVRTILTVLVPWALAADSITWGLIVANIADVSPNSLVNPFTRPGDDWARLNREEPDTTGVAFSPGEQFVLKCDSRSKRRVDELGQTWTFCWQNGAAGNKTLGVYARTLVALP